MIKGRRKVKNRKKGIPYFNFGKFEKALDNLLEKGIDITSVEYPVKNLKKFNDFKHFFDNFSEQQIKAQLTFYSKQFEDTFEKSEDW